MKNLIQKLFTPGRGTSDDLTQPQREALIDLMILGMFADNNIALSEDELLRKETEAFDWDSGENLDYYIDKRIGTLRVIRQEPTTLDETLHDIAVRLADKSDHALKLLKEIFISDGEEAEKEREFYTKIERIFSDQN